MFCGPCYAICTVVLFCLSLYEDSKARNQGNTSVQYFFWVLNIAYFSVGNLAFVKKWSVNSQPIKSINQPISD